VSLRRLARNWNAFAAADPLWSILTWPEKRGNRWQEDEFFATGREEVAVALRRARELCPRMGAGRALDFGCGVGRLTLALADSFTAAHGVDIAPGMIAAARRFDAAGAVAGYHVNAKPDLGLFDDGHFDFVYSSITLQHMAPRWIRGYLREFGRVLAVGGVVAFQLPSVPRRAPNPNPLVHRLGALGAGMLLRFKAACSHAPVMDMHGLPRTEVERSLREAGCELRAVDPSTLAGADWESWLYFAERTGPAGSPCGRG
jgi:SAM-dependent methyltransferase